MLEEPIETPITFMTDAQYAQIIKRSLELAGVEKYGWTYKRFNYPSWTSNNYQRMRVNILKGPKIQHSMFVEFKNNIAFVNFEGKKLEYVLDLTPEV